MTRSWIPTQGAMLCLSPNRSDVTHTPSDYRRSRDSEIPKLLQVDLFFLTSLPVCDP